MSGIDDFIQKFNNLNISQQRLVSDLVEEITTKNEEQNVVPTSVNRRPNHKFISSNNIPLAIGDRVRVLNSRKTGKHGDTAIVKKFNKLYVAIELDSNGSITQRAAKNLELVSYHE